MNRELILRYQPGGDIYAQLEQQYGGNAAIQIASVARTGDSRAITETLARIRNGERLPDSTVALLWTQLTTDPLGAPLDSANRQISALAGNTAMAFLRNPMVLLVLAVVGFGVWVNFFGFPKWLKPAR